MRLAFPDVLVKFCMFGQPIVVATPPGVWPQQSQSFLLAMSINSKINNILIPMIGYYWSHLTISLKYLLLLTFFGEGGQTKPVSKFRLTTWAMLVTHTYLGLTLLKCPATHPPNWWRILQLPSQRGTVSSSAWRGLHGESASVVDSTVPHCELVKEETDDSGDNNVLYMEASFRTLKVNLLD